MLEVKFRYRTVDLNYSRVVASSINMESTDPLTRLQARLGSRFAVVAPDRRLVTDGMLFEELGNGTTFTSNVRECYLFNDVFLVLQPGVKAELKLVQLPLRGALVQDLEWKRATDAAILEDAILVSSPGCKPTILVAPDHDYKKLWLKHFRSALAAPSAEAASNADGVLHTLVTGTLWHAAVTNDVAVAKALVDLRNDGAEHIDVNESDEDGMSPLMYAVLRGHVAVAAELVRASASLEAVTVDYETPLHIAAKRGDVDMVHLLAANGAMLDARDLLEQTPLHVTVGTASLPFSVVVHVARVLLTHGADPTLADAAGLQALHLAVLAGNLEIVPMLIRNGADANAFAEFALQCDSVPRSDSYSPLHLCCTPQVESHLLRDAAQWPRPVNIELVDCLLAHGAQPNLRSGTAGHTALHMLISAAAQAKKQPPAHDLVHLFFATVQTAVTRLALAGARLDVNDAAGVTSAALAQSLGLRATLDAALRSFSARGAPTNVALVAPRLKHKFLAPGSTGILLSSLAHKLRASVSPKVGAKKTGRCC